MTVEIRFDTGDGSALATNKGWSDFGVWTDGLDEDDYPLAVHLRDFGFSNDPTALAKELETAAEKSPPEADGLDKTLLRLCDLLLAHEDVETVFVTNGLAPDNEDDEEPDGDKNMTVERSDATDERPNPAPGDGAGDDKPKDGEGDDDKDEVLPGAKLLMSYHKKLDALVDHLESGLSKQENKAVTAHVTKRMGVHGEQRDETMECLKSAYPDLEVKEDGDDEDEPKDDKSGEKKALRVRKLAPTAAAAVLHRSVILDEMARAENLSHQQRAILVDAAAGLRAAAIDVDDDLDPETAKILLPAIQELTKTYKRFRQTLLAATGKR